MIPIQDEDLPPDYAGGRGTDRFIDIMTASLAAVMVLQYRRLLMQRLDELSR